MATASVINAAKINGNDMVLLADTSLTDTPSYKPVLCGVNLSLTRAISTQDNSSKCGDDISPDKETGSAQFTGFILNSTITDFYSIGDLHALVSAKKQIKWMIAPATGVPTANMPSYSFVGFITNIQDTYDVNTKGKVQFTVTANGGVTFANLV